MAVPACPWSVGAGVLSALNQLRHFAPTSIKPRLAAQLQQALQAVGAIMVRYHDPRGARETETTLFLAMCKAFIEARPCARSSCRRHPVWGHGWDERMG